GAGVKPSGWARSRICGSQASPRSAALPEARVRRCGSSRALEQCCSRVKYFLRQQRLHAAVIQRADPPLARTALDPFLQMDGLGKVGLCPGDVGWAKQTDHRPIECGSEVPRAAVGGNEEVAAAHTSLGQAHRQGVIGQGRHCRHPAHIRNGSCGLAFCGPAKDENPTTQPVNQLARESSKVFRGPVLRGTKCSAWTQTDYGLMTGQVGLMPNGIRGGLVAWD